ncbi:hypothetical protein [Nonomuraea sp. SYSU D8015]|uniref:hypothetical protein n=1 Tax=Nonomuraea sp. SYSU D8015 TaxID=2593644 RepID=UPI0016609FAE|nr:hypothetical protein [Nonomuraea sp. SYSU D8015]
MTRHGVDYSRLKVTSRQQIAHLRAQRAHERKWRDVRKLAHLYRQVRLGALLIGIAATTVVALLRGWGVLPPLP